MIKLRGNTIKIGK